MFYLIFLFCKYLRWVQYARNRVHWTHFVRLENEFNELGFYSCKPSSLNLVCFSPSLLGTCQPSQAPLSHKKTNTQKKLSSNFKHTVTLSHSLSLSVSLSHEKSSSLSLSHSHSEPVAPSPAPSSTAPVAVAASRFRRCRCLSLPSVRLRLAQSFSLSGWRTTSQK